MYFEHNYMNIDAVLTMPDTDTIEIIREKNLKSDNTVKLTLSLEVQTYYPAFTSNKDCKIETIGTSVCSVGQINTNVVKVGPVFSKSCIGSNKKTSSISEIGVGNQLIGNGIPNGVYVTSINVVDSEVTISKNIECNIINNTISFLQNPGDVVYPYRTRWFNNLQPISMRNASSSNPNSGSSNLDDNSVL